MFLAVYYSGMVCARTIKGFGAVARAGFDFSEVNAGTPRREDAKKNDKEESPKVPTNIPPAELKRLYAKHKNDVEAQLRDGQSWIKCDENTVDKLATAVPSHLGFFRLKAEEDFFVVQDVLRRTELYKKHPKILTRFQTSRGNTDAQKAWIHILLEEERRTGDSEDMKTAQIKY